MAGVAAGLLAAPLMGVPQAPPAFAECNPYRTDNYETHYWAGTQRLSMPTAPRAVRANIEVKDTWVETQDFRFAVGYVMLRQNLASGGYAQVGWWEYDNQERHTFVQQTRSGGGFDNWFHPKHDPGEAPFYAVWQDPANDDYVYFVNGVEQERRPRDFFPQGASIVAEINSLATQMPGTLPAPQYVVNEHFNDADMYINGAYQDFNGSEYNTNTSLFGMKKINGRHYDVWDKLDCS